MTDPRYRVAAPDDTRGLLADGSNYVSDLKATPTRARRKLNAVLRGAAVIGGVLIAAGAITASARR